MPLTDHVGLTSDMLDFMSSLSTLVLVVVFFSSLACGALCALCLNRRCAKAAIAMNGVERRGEAKTIDMQVIDSRNPPVLAPIGGSKNDNIA